MTMDIKEQTIRLIDELKATCANYGMGNDGNEYLKSATKPFNVLLACTHPLITEFADDLN